MKVLNKFKSPVLFSQSWEDHKVIEEGLEINKNQVLVSIIASGDNVLNFLIYQPKLIYAFDSSEAQIHEIKLKKIAIKYLEYEEFIKLLGYSGDKKERVSIYRSISDLLDEKSCKFWNRNVKMIRKGLSFEGRWERHVILWRYLLKFLLGPDFKRYIISYDKDERREIFEKRICRPSLILISNSILGRVFINLFFKRRVFKKLGKKHKYKDIFWNRSKHFIVDINCINNPYHYWLFTGEPPKSRECWQPYLQKKNFETLKKNIDKIKIIQKDLFHGLEELKSSNIDAFYLSDIFDWMNVKEMEKTLSEVVRVGKNKSKIVCFVLNSDKKLPKRLEKNIIHDKKKSDELTIAERVGLYLRVYRLIIKK